MAIVQDPNAPSGWGKDSTTGQLAKIPTNVQEQTVQAAQSSVGTLQKSPVLGANQVQVGTTPTAQTYQAFAWAPGVQEPQRQYETPGLKSWTNEEAANMRTGVGSNNATADQVGQFYADRNVTSHYDEKSGQWVSGNTSAAFDGAPKITVGEGSPNARKYDTGPTTVNFLIQKFKSGSLTDGNDIEAFNKMVQMGLINTDAFGEKIKAGSISSNDARIQQVQLSDQLKQLDQQAAGFNQGYANQQSLINDKQASETAQLTEEQRQAAATNTAWQIKSERSGTTQGAAETAGMMQKFNWQLEAVQTKYNDLRRQAESELQKGNIEAAKELRAQAQQELDNGIKLRAEARDSELKTQQLEKASRDNLDGTTKSWAEAGLEPSEEDFMSLDKKYDLDPGASKLSYLAQKSSVDMTAKKDKVALAKDMAALGKANFDLQMQSFDQIKKIGDALDTIPAGQTLTMPDGSMYYGTKGTGKVEFDGSGFGRMAYVDQETGALRIKDIGQIGKADQSSLKTSWVDGHLVVKNTTTNGLAAAIPSGGADGDCAIDKYFPQGSNGGQCLAWCHNFVTDLPYGMNTAQQKKSIVNVPKTELPQVGDVALFDGGQSGHAAMVTYAAVADDGTPIIQLSESNIKLDEKVTHGRTISSDNPKLFGYFRGHLNEKFFSELGDKQPEEQQSSLAGSIAKTGSVVGQEGKVLSQPPVQPKKKGFDESTFTVPPSTKLEHFSGTQEAHDKALMDEEDAKTAALNLLSGTGTKLTDVPQGIRQRALEIARANGLGEGEADRSQMSDDDLQLAEMIANYDADPQKTTSIRSSGAGNSSERARIVAEAKRLNPDLDLTNYAAKQNFKNAWSSGKYNNTNQSLNLVVGHMAELKEASNKLKEMEYLSGENEGLNWLQNIEKSSIISPYAGRDWRAAKSQFDTALQGVAGELTTAFRNTGSSVVEVEAWKKNFDSLESASGVQGSIQTAVDMLASRLQAQAENHKKNLGVYPQQKVLDMDALNALSSLGVDTSKLERLNSLTGFAIKLPDGKVVNFESRDDRKKFMDKYGLKD